MPNHCGVPNGNQRKGLPCSAGTLLVCAQWPNDESQQCDSTAQGASECANHVIVPPPTCICSDVQVQPASSAGPVFTCAQQYNTGNCGKPFLKNAIKGLPEGQSQLPKLQSTCSMQQSTRQRSFYTNCHERIPVQALSKGLPLVSLWHQRTARDILAFAGSLCSCILHAPLLHSGSMLYKCNLQGTVS